MQSIFFLVQMDTLVGIPEFFLEETTVGQRQHDGNHCYTVDDVRESLLLMLLQLRAPTSPEDEKEYDLDICENEIVFWELGPEADNYDTTTVERIAMTIAEIEHQLEELADLENRVHVLLNKGQQMPHDWKEDGF